MTTTVNDVISANAALESAFENLATAVAIAKPKNYKGMSLAMEDAGGDGVQEAKKGIFQKLKELIKRFFDFILRRNKGVEDKAAEAVEKMEKKKEDVGDWVGEMMDRVMKQKKDASTANAETGVVKLLNAVNKRTSDIEKAIIETIDDKLESDEFLYAYIGGDSWGLSDLQKIINNLNELIGTRDKCLNYVKQYKAALDGGKFDVIKQINENDILKSVKVRGMNKPSNHGYKFKGSLSGWQAKWDHLGGTLKSIASKSGDDLTKELSDLEKSMNTAFAKAEQSGDSESATILQETISVKLTQISMAFISVKSHLTQGAQLVSKALGLISGVETSGPLIEVEKAIKQEVPDASQTEISIMVYGEVLTRLAF